MNEPSKGENKIKDFTTGNKSEGKQLKDLKNQHLKKEGTNSI